MSAGGTPDLCFRAVRPHPAPAVRLVCFPHAGGTANFFRPWAVLVPDGVEVLAAKYPARETRFLDEPAQTMAELVDELAAASAGLFDTTVAFFGHSMGASVAYELSIRLRERHGVGPDALFVSGRGGPGRERRPGLAEAGDDELVDAVLELGGTDATVLRDPALRDLVLPAIRADYRLLDRYTAHRPDERSTLDVPVTAYHGSDDTDIVDAVGAWSATTRSTFRARSFPGGHFYLVGAAGDLVRDLLQHLPIATATKRKGLS
ncbi:pyochelin biosynthetic protein PchC [Micromonospora pisi]|uniref:Pyochelin biosynthetic protein PchC n=1 Tax=Micromonospora pisi TaxID=589240 RepID=A0A495JCM1_9ACTN|nr:thioesterase domain-containing protein [Micromonospora pisi]RKR86481.1 pyochelin biosynthetic protein PchC [Micromonospora pisi]